MKTFISEINEICYKNRDMKTYIDNVKKEHTGYLEQNTSYFENVVNITVDIDSIIPMEK